MGNTQVFPFPAEQYCIYVLNMIFVCWLLQSFKDKGAVIKRYLKKQHYGKDSGKRDYLLKCEIHLRLIPKNMNDCKSTPCEMF